jgi:hypothetical protein
MSKINKNTKIVIAVIIVLTVTVVIFAILNRDNIAERKAMQDSGTFIITAVDGTRYNVTMYDILSLNPHVIDANYKKSGKEPVQKQYTGVSLKRLFDYFDIDYLLTKSVSFTAADGYASAISIDDALDENNCFIVFEEEGEPLGTKESGGKGPFMMILANDQFSQRWCKFLLEVEIKGG